MVDGLDQAESVAILQARVAALEEALEKRSRELRQIQRLVSVPDLLLISRVVSGFKGRRASDLFSIEAWQETTALRPAEVEQTLEDLWRTVGDERAEDER